MLETIQHTILLNNFSISLRQGVSLYQPMQDDFVISLNSLIFISLCMVHVSEEDYRGQLSKMKESALYNGGILWNLTDYDI